MRNVASKKVETFADRIKDAAKVFGIRTPAEFSRFIGVSPQTGYKWWAGQTPNISAQDLFRIQKKLKVRAGWLLEGEGPRHRSDHPTPDEQRVLEIYRAFKPEHEEFRETWVNQGAQLAESLAKVPSLAIPYPVRPK